MEPRSDLLALQRRRTLPADVVSDLLERADHVVRTVSRLRSSLAP
jgi:hypothetical protein